MSLSKMILILSFDQPLRYWTTAFFGTIKVANITEALQAVFSNDAASDNVLVISLLFHAIQMLIDST